MRTPETNWCLLYGDLDRIISEENKEDIHEEVL